MAPLAQDGANPRHLTGHTKAVTSLAIIGVGRCVLSGSLDGTVRLWSVAGPSTLHVFRLPQPVYSLAFGPALLSMSDKLQQGVEGEGQGLVAFAGLQDGTVHMLDLSNREKETNPLRKLKLGSSGVEAVAYDEATGRVVAGTRDGTVAVFELSGPAPNDASTPLEPVLRFARGAASITSLAYSPHSSLADSTDAPTPTVLIGTLDGLPYRVALLEEEGGSLGARVVEEFAGLDCDRCVVPASGRDVFVAAADGKLRRYFA